MSRIGQAGRSIVYGLVLAAAPAICSAQTAGTNGGAKISAPVVSGVGDPFVNATPAATVSPIPTPIMTSSGQVAEASAAIKPIVPKSSMAAELRPIATPPASPTPTNVIDAGKLVPLTSPTTKPQTVREPTPDDKLAETAPAGLKPIQPSPAITRETVTTPVVNAATKAKPAPTKKPAAKPKPVEPARDQIAPAVNFSFPQPVIPLESALRKFFKWSASRR